MKLFLGFGCAALCLGLVGCHNTPSTVSTSSSTTGTAEVAPPGELKKLGMEDVVVGKGDSAEVGDTVYIEYTGKLANGVQFDSNVPADPKAPDKAPISFYITKDTATVIPGWNQGIVGMKVGGQRKLSIPWILGYGVQGRPGSIPPKADLYFDVKLLGLLKKGKSLDLGEKDLKVGSGPAAKNGDWVTISYDATLLNGYKVDSSSDHSTALQFQAGTGEAGGGMIVPFKGVVAGVIGMQLGGERLLVCPPALATNSSSRPSEKVPGDSIVRFNIKLLRISPKQADDMPTPKS